MLMAWKQSHPAWHDDKPLKIVKAAFNYAARKGIIKASPIRGAETKTSAGHGADDDFFFTVEGEEVFRKRITNPAFYLFFSASIETGARPGELATLTPKHAKENGGKLFWVLEPHEWKNGRKTQRKRIIAITKEWQEWTQQRLGDSPSYLFETSRGSQWSEDAWCDNFDRTLTAAIKAGASLTSELTFYSARHTWIYRRVKEGKPITHIASAAGTSVKQIEKVYDKTYGDFQTIASVLD
jgi:integrase